MQENPNLTPLQPAPVPSNPPPATPTSPEVLLPRLGDYLIEQNLITADELESALAHQKKSQEAGKPILLGQALLELDLIDPPDLDRAVVHQLTSLHYALQQANRQLESRVQQRTHDLERRLQQIRAAAEITQMAVSASSLTELFQRSVDLIVERFGYYSAAIYLVDGLHRYLHLAEAAGPFAAILRQRKLKILIGSRSVVGWVAANNRPRLVADVRQDFLATEYETSAGWASEGAEATAVLPGPATTPQTQLAILSQTRSQATVPVAIQFENPERQASGEILDPFSDRFAFHRQAAESMLLHGRVLGVLDVQSENPAAFDEDVIAVFQTIASHIASTIYNARLLDSARKSLTETMVLYRAGQEFTRAHSIREVYRSLWNALTSLARDSGFPNMLLIPSGAADLTSTPWERLIAPDEPQMREDSSESIRTAETIPIRFLRTYAPVPDAETGTPGAQASSSSRENRPSDYITTALVDAAIPAPEISTAAAGGLPFLVMDTTQPSSYPAPFQDLAVRLNSRAIALVPVRSAIGGAMRITALIVSGLSPSTPAGESPSGNAAGSAAGSNQDYIVQTCVSIAELSAGAFVRVAAADVMEKRLLALQSLSNISQYISAEMELLDVYKAIHIEVNRIIGDVNFLIALYDPDTNYIQVPYLYESGQLDVRAIPPFPLGEGLTSILINTHKPLMINENTEERARQLGAKTVGRPSRSWLGVPLVLANQVYGAIIVQDLEQEHRFDEDDQNLLVTLASQVAIAIRTTRLLASVRRQAERQEQLNRITTLIRSSNDMQAVLQIASTELSKALAPAGVARVVTEIDPAPTQSTPTQADV